MHPNGQQFPGPGGGGGADGSRLAGWGMGHIRGLDPVGDATPECLICLFVFHANMPALPAGVKYVYMHVYLSAFMSKCLYAYEHDAPVGTTSQD